MAKKKRATTKKSVTKKTKGETSRTAATKKRVTTKRTMTKKRKVAEANEITKSKKPAKKKATKTIVEQPRESSTVFVESRRKPTAARPYVFEKVASSEEFQAEYEAREEELKGQRVKAEITLKKFAKKLIKGEYGPITGYSVGFRTKFGRIVLPLQYVIQVNVPAKLPNYLFHTTDKENKLEFKPLPSEWEEIQVKVVESRPFLLQENVEGVLLSGAQSVPDTTIPPNTELCGTIVKGGLPAREMGVDPRFWGTLGVCYLGDDGEFRALVNGHFARLDTVMVQPPKQIPSMCWQIGKVEKSVFLERSSRGASVDAAIIKLSVSNRDYTSVDTVEKILGAKDYAIFFATDELPGSLHGKQVFKFGARTQQFLSGQIINLTFSDLVIGGLEVSKVVEVRSSGGTFTLGGDSGSALLIPITTIAGNRDAFLVGGLFFAGVENAPDVGYACQMTDIFDLMKNVISIPQEKRLGRFDWKYRLHSV